MLWSLFYIPKDIKAFLKDTNTISHIPREPNHQVDSLAEVGVTGKHSYCAWINSLVPVALLFFSVCQVIP